MNTKEGIEMFSICVCVYMKECIERMAYKVCMNQGCKSGTDNIFHLEKQKRRKDRGGTFFFKKKKSKFKTSFC